MKIYDSLSESKTSLPPKKVTIYNCGPTVYNHVHIGNIRPLITFDILNRFLSWKGVEVQYLHNITDIDDKIINRAQEENRSEKEVSENYYNEYLKIVEALNVKKMTMPKVSDHIPEIIDYVQRIVDKNFAYVADGDVYIDLKSIPNYGEVSHQKIDELLDGVRKENLSNKRFPLDFVLWKSTKAGLNWKSPWSYGRPGWHTECSVLINKYIGEQVDIHGGGIDLKFPHHENENAQNIALHKKGIAKVWMHVGHVNVEGQKMSKSLNNFILAKDIFLKYEPNVVRWFFLQTQYQNPINFSIEVLDQVKNDFNKFIKTMNLTYINLLMEKINPTEDNFNSISENLVQVLEDDLNLPNALMNILKQAKETRQDFSIALSKLKENRIEEYKVIINSIKTNFNQIIKALNILGIDYKISLDQEAHKLIDEWKEAINKKDYKKIDECRNYFNEKGLI